MLQLENESELLRKSPLQKSNIGAYAQLICERIQSLLNKNALVKSASFTIAAVVMHVRAEAGVITQIYITDTSTTNPWEIAVTVPGTGDESFGFNEGLFTTTITRNDLNLAMTSLRFTLPTNPGQDGYIWHNISPVSTGDPQNRAWNPDAFVSDSKSVLLLPGIGEELLSLNDNFAFSSDLSVLQAGGTNVDGDFLFDPFDLELEAAVDGDLLSATSAITPAQFAGSRTLYISGTVAVPAAVPEPTTVGLLATFGAALGLKWLRNKKNSAAR